MFSETIKNTLKHGYYAVRPARLPEDLKLSLGYVVHTERCYDRAVFERLVGFCKEFTAITGRKTICTVMSGTNPRIEGGCRRHGLSDAGYAERLAELSTVAWLGYHGHFWLDPELVRAREAQATSDRFHSKELELRCNNFLMEPLRQQVTADLAWFKRHGLDHHNAYAGGWWFTNRELIGLLLDEGFRYDFSFSHSVWFRNEFSYMMMETNQLAPGVPFAIRKGDREMLCTQMLIGCHQTPFVDDFRRNLAALLGPQRAVRGVVGSHDYDLDVPHTVEVLRALASSREATFFDLPDLQARTGIERLQRFELERC